MNLPNQDGFTRIVKALGPYRADLVIAGAWCHRLYHFHPLAMIPPFPPLMSDDADVATPEVLPAKKVSIAELLEAAGFKPDFGGDDPLPASKYYPVEDVRGLYVEFITPLRGGGYTRRGELADTLIIAGISAARLRHVDLLLFEPWSLQLRERDGFPVGQDDLVIQVANPASYLAQKVLSVARRRKATKMAKDVLYIHDTLIMFGNSLESLRPQAARVFGRLHRTTARRFHAERVKLFIDQGLLEDAAAMAAATGRPSPPSAATIAAVCSAGLDLVFGA